MKRKKVDAPEPKPAPSGPVSLLRVEERIERVAITPEQVTERMHAAAAMIDEANALDARVLDLKEQLKDVKQRAEIKHYEAERIVTDARMGTMAAAYGVIVERHPTHPTEMIEWRVPDGFLPADLVDALSPDLQGEERIAAREQQGCILVDPRAMTADELAVAQEEDQRRAQPSLPFPDPAGKTAEPPPPEPVATAPVVGGGEEPTPVADPAAEQPNAEEPAAGDRPTDDPPEEATPDPAPAAAPAENGAPNGNGHRGKRPPSDRGRAPKHAGRVKAALAKMPDRSGKAGEIAGELDLHPDDIKPALTWLVDGGEAVTSGKARGLTYHLTPGAEDSKAAH